MSVSQGQCAQMAKSKAAVEIKKMIQYNPVDFFLTSMRRFFFKNKAESSIVLHTRIFIPTYPVHFSIFAL